MREQVELRHLKYFVAVAEQLHFGLAADTLGITQPALSQQLRQLETLLDTTLLHRTSRRVQLTAAGEVLLDRAVALLSRADADLDEAVRTGRGKVGQIELAFVSSAARVVSQVLASLRRDLPDVRARLAEGFTDDALRRLDSGLADIAFVRDPEPRAGLVSVPLLVEPFAIAVPSGHRLARRRAVRADELRDSPLVLFPSSAGAAAHTANLQPFRERGIEPVIAAEGSHWSTILHLVATGAGITLVPLSAADPLPDGVTLIRLRDTSATSTVHVVTRSGDDRPITTRVVELARAASTGRH